MSEGRGGTDVLRPADGHASDAGDLLEAEVGEGLAGLALRARLASESTASGARGKVSKGWSGGRE